MHDKKMKIPYNWNVETFDKIFEFLPTATNSRNELQKSGDIMYIHYGDIHTKWKTVLDCNNDKIPFIEKKKIKNTPFLTEGDIIIVDASEDHNGSGTSILLRNVNNKKIVSGLHTIAIRDKYEKTYIGFRAYITSIIYVKKQIIKNVSGISVYGLSKKNLKSIRIPLPTLLEQQKIASILSRVDALIESTQECIEKTQKLKKGLMQTLLIKGIGHKKFKKIKIMFDIELEIPQNWEMRNIEKCCNILDSKRIPINSNNRKKIHGSIPYYGANGIQDYINEYIFDEELILLAEDGGYFQEYKIKPIAQYIIGKCWVNNHAHVLNAKSNSFLKWIFYSLIHKNVIPYINGSTRTKLNQSDLKQIEILCPPLSEQQKIASILSGIDSHIQSNQNYKEKLIKLKKGLMQKLLTGQLRVKI